MKELYYRFGRDALGGISVEEGTKYIYLTSHTRVQGQEIIKYRFEKERTHEVLNFLKEYDFYPEENFLNGKVVQRIKVQ